MRRQIVLAAALLSVTLAACGTEAIGPKPSQTPGQSGPSLTSSDGTVTCSFADVSNDLSTLMANLTPNDNSALSKFQYVQTLMSYNNPDSTAKARAYAQSPLISFITLKYSQAPLTQQQEDSVLFKKVIAEINCFVGMYTIPTTNTAVAVALNDGKGGVWFPANFCDDNCSGINVTLDEQYPCTAPGVPANCVPALSTLLDKYGFYLKVTLTGDTPNPGADPSVVALCTPDGLSQDLINRLLVGHQNDGTLDAANFALLDKAGIPTELAQLLVCAPLSVTQANTPAGMLARFASKVADWVLPEQLHAMFFATSGIGGSTRTFSPFTLTDPTMSATGGLGGSKGSFSPAKPGASAPAKPSASSGKPNRGASLTTVPPGTLTDTAGAVWKPATNLLLPTITVKTAQNTAIPGVRIKFTVNDPSSSFTPSSAAGVCNPTDSTIADSLAYRTGDDGSAQLGCLNFGTTLGYKNLHVLIDPSTADGLAGGGTSNIQVTTCDAGGCTTGTTNELNWLVQTVPGNPAKLALIDPQPPTSARAGIALNPQPTIQVQDRSGFPVLTWGQAITAGISSSPGGQVSPYPNLANASASTSGGSTATFSGLAINGKVGPYQLTSTSGSLTGVTADITLNAGDAYSILPYMSGAAIATGTYTYPSLLTPGATPTPSPTAVVLDLFNNRVDSTVTWTAVNSTVAGGSTTTTSAIGGLASVGSWVIGTGESDLLASVAGVSSPATFIASTPLGASVLMCELGTADGDFLTYDNNKQKIDLAPIKVADPKKNIVDMYFFMSVTGQSSTFATYNVNLNVYRTAGSATSPGTTLVGSSAGTVALPGNNGKPQLQHIRLTSPVLATTTNGQALWFVMSVTTPASGRTFQVWYSTLASNKLSQDCKGSYVGTGSTAKQGAAILLKN